jgi:hypothetical protein
MVTILADALCAGVSIGNSGVAATSVMLIQTAANNALTFF